MKVYWFISYAHAIPSIIPEYPPLSWHFDNTMVETENDGTLDLKKLEEKLVHDVRGFAKIMNFQEVSGLVYETWQKSL